MTSDKKPPINSPVVSGGTAFLEDQINVISVESAYRDIDIGFDGDAVYTSHFDISSDQCLKFVIECTSVAYDLPKPPCPPLLRSSLALC